MAAVYWFTICNSVKVICCVYWRGEMGHLSLSLFASHMSVVLSFMLHCWWAVPRASIAQPRKRCSSSPSVNSAVGTFCNILVHTVAQLSRVAGSSRMTDTQPNRWPCSWTLSRGSLWTFSARCAPACTIQAFSSGQPELETMCCPRCGATLETSKLLNWPKVFLGKVFNFLGYLEDWKPVAVELNHIPF